MSWTRLLRYFANGQIVEELANTSIFRRGAQLIHYAYQQGMKKLNDVAHVGQTSKNTADLKKPLPLTSFARTFARNLQKEIDKEIKKQ